MTTLDDVFILLKAVNETTLGRMEGEINAINQVTLSRLEGEIKDIQSYLDVHLP